MKAALQVHRTRITDEMLRQEIFPVLEACGVGYELLPRFHDGNVEVSADTDFILVLGGDGTFLAGARLATRLELPILGVMVGRLGFLCSVSLEEMGGALAEIKDSRMPLEERNVLEGSIVSGGVTKANGLAVNDIVVFRHEHDKIRDFSARQCGTLIANYRADGIIVSSALGSTAYTLAAGGPLVHPQMNVMVLTPICAHSLFTKPLVVPPDDGVEIQGHEQSYPLMVTFDGSQRHVLGLGDKIVVKAYKQNLKVFRPEKADFYEVLRQKFQHGYLYGEQND